MAADWAERLNSSRVQASCGNKPSRTLAALRAVPGKQPAQSAPGGVLRVSCHESGHDQVSESKNEIVSTLYS